MMLNGNPLDILRAKIENRERALVSSFQADKRYALMEIIRAVDIYIWYALSQEGDDANQELGSERNNIYQFGIPKALSLFVGGHCTSTGAPLAQSTKELQEWAESVIWHSGYLGMCEMIVDLARYKLVDVSMPSDTEIRVTTRGKYLGMELREKEEFSILGQLAIEMDKEARDDVLSQRKEMISRMAGLVNTWREHYIQYVAAPEIDAYYERLGLLWTRSHCIGADSFPGDAIFGGLPYNLYKAVVATMVGWTWKHIDFCQALWEKHPNLELRNILTITHNHDLHCGYLAGALDVDIDNVVSALSAITLTPDNKSFHLSTPRTYVAPVIQMSSDSVVCPLAGMLSESPFYFLLTELRRKFPQDWDRAVNLREEQFRNELVFLFPGKEMLIATKPVKAKTGEHTLTDIDAAVFDQRNGTLGLFQLKWQDFFGTSMQKRETKKRNLLAETNSWINTITLWLADKDPDVIARACGLDRLIKRKISRVLLFVLGRNSVHFSGDELPDSRAAWGMWPQALRLFKEGLEAKTYDASDPLSWLHAMLVKESPFLKSTPELESYEFEVDGLRVVLQ